jgi:hypothetical protein
MLGDFSPPRLGARREARLLRVANAPYSTHTMPHRTVQTLTDIKMLSRMRVGARARLFGPGDCSHDPAK